MFTPEELAEMAAADAEIEAEFRLTQEDLDRSYKLDREAKFRALPMEKQKLAARQKAYREANREKVAEYQKAYREANREKVRERARNYMRAYRTKREPPQVLEHPRRQRNSKTPILYGTRKESSRCSQTNI